MYAPDSPAHQGDSPPPPDSLPRGLVLPHAMLDPRNDRQAMIPVAYPDLYEWYLKARDSFWTPEELTLTDDRRHWEERLGDDERHFIKLVLAFFATSDFIVNENLARSFAAQVTVPEARLFYNFQSAMEDIHSIMYARLLEAYVADTAERAGLLAAVDTVPAIAAKAAWARRWIRDGTFLERLVAFAVVEGVFFSASFCAIFWLKSKGLMPGLASSNELIARDEGLHRDFACHLYTGHTRPEERLARAGVLAIVDEAVALEQEFVRTALPVGLIGMNADLMCRYVRVVADHLLRSLGEEPAEPTPANPFPFMDAICLDTKTNFFEGRVTSYRKAVGRDAGQGQGQGQGSGPVSVSVSADGVMYGCDF